MFRTDCTCPRIVFVCINTCFNKHIASSVRFQDTMHLHTITLHPVCVSKTPGTCTRSLSHWFNYLQGTYSFLFPNLLLLQSVVQCPFLLQCILGRPLSPVILGLSLLSIMLVSKFMDLWKICISSLCSIDKLLFTSFSFFSFLL